MLKMLSYLGAGCLAIGIVGLVGCALIAIVAALYLLVQKIGVVGAIVGLIACGWTMMATAEHFQTKS